MRLLNSRYGINIEFRENEINTLIVEKPEFLTDVVQNIMKQIEGEEGDFVLSDNTSIKIDKDVVRISGGDNQAQPELIDRPTQED